MAKENHVGGKKMRADQFAEFHARLWKLMMLDTIPLDNEIPYRSVRSPSLVFHNIIRGEKEESA